MQNLTAAATDDPALTYAFLRVVNMLAKPQTLFAPKILLRVFRARRAARVRELTQRTPTEEVNLKS